MRFKRPATVSATMVFSCMFPVASAQDPVADGQFVEWAGVPILQTDPSSDAIGAFDVTAIQAASRGTDLFLQFDTTATRNLIAGSSSDGDFRVVINVAGDDLILDYRNRTVRFDGTAMSWVDVGAVLQPSFASSLFELRVDLSTVGVSLGDTVSISINGSDSVAPAAFTLLDASIAPDRRSVDRDSAAAVRVASLNTKNTGLTSGDRARFERLIDAVDADIYCFQEEYNSSAAQVANVIESADPFGDGASWNIQKNNDNVVASRSPLIGAPESNSKYVAALVDLGGGDAVFVLSIHPKCCGFIGSSEDQQRVGEFADMADTINDFRAGTLGPALAPFADAPVLVIGDYNLVGSRAPLDVLLDPAGPGLVPLTLRGLIGRDVITWLNAGSSFAPGRLDLAVYSPDDLFPVGSFVLDSRELNPGELADLGLQGPDSAASDHLTLVADFSFDPVGQPDLDGDGFVDGGDLASLLAQWGGNGNADLNGDGIVDGADLAIMLASWS